MKLVRRIGLAAAAVVIGIGVVGGTTSVAHADTSWGMKKMAPKTVETQPTDTSWGQG